MYFLNDTTKIGWDAGLNNFRIFPDFKFKILSKFQASEVLGPAEIIDELQLLIKGSFCDSKTDF